MTFLIVSLFVFSVDFQYKRRTSNRSFFAIVTFLSLTAEAHWVLVIPQTQAGGKKESFQKLWTIHHEYDLEQ
jgi:hypothetical protein